MIRQRDEVERVFAQSLVVRFHVVVKRLFVRQVDVAFEVVAHFELVARERVFLDDLRRCSSLFRVARSKALHSRYFLRWKHILRCCQRRQRCCL